MTKEFEELMSRGNKSICAMNLRDWFAGEALKGLLSTCTVLGYASADELELAIWSYKQADAMMTARERKS